MALIKIKCLDCDRITEFEESEFDEDNLKCRECGGYFKECYEETDDNESDDDEDSDEEEVVEDENIPSVLSPEHSDDNLQTDKIDIDSKTRFD